MASRFSAARPKRAGELYARELHGQNGHHGAAAGDDDDDDAAGGGPAKKVKFDVRNPSNLAPDAREEDEILDADVIGRGGTATKRGAVNVDGYDSDSDNETFLARAARRAGPGPGKAETAGGKMTGSGFSADAADDVKVDLIDQLDNYDKRLKGDPGAGGGTNKDDDDDDDMFAEHDDADGPDPAAGGGGDATAGRKTWKEVRFLGTNGIVGEEKSSRSGGRVRLDEEEEDDDEEKDVEDEEEEDDDDDDEEAALALQENPVDDEVGAGGLKKHAPRLDAFNMRQEQEEGAFDEAGNYIRKAADPDAQHDRWLDGIGKKAVRAAAAAHAQRAAALRAQRAADDGVPTSELLAALLRRLHRGETVLEALARLGRTAAAGKAPRAKQRVPQWRRDKARARGGEAAMDVDESEPAAASASTPSSSDTPAARAKADIEALTEAADHLLNRDFPDIYDTERERLQRDYRAETGEPWTDPPPDAAAAAADAPWEYRWADGRADTAVQGPFDGPTMQAWQDAGYFAGGIESRRCGDDAWEQRTSFV